MVYFDYYEDEDEFYEVEAIEKHRYNSKSKKDEYFVKWRGYPKSQNSWVSKKDLNCDDLLAEFERKSKKSAKPTSRQKRRERKHTLRSGSKATKFKPESESESEPESEPESESESESGSEEEDGNKGEDDYKKYLALPLGSWESKVVVVEHISEPEDGDLVVYVKMKSGKNKFAVEKYPARVIKWLAPIKLIDYYEKHIIFSQR